VADHGGEAVPQAGDQNHPVSGNLWQESELGDDRLMHAAVGCVAQQHVIERWQKTTCNHYHQQVFELTAEPADHAGAAS